MKAREIFALVIRILGLIGLAHVFHSVLVDIYHDLPLLRLDYYFVKAIYLAVGFYCLRGAPQLVALAYGCETAAPQIRPPAS
jgi:hypothetical protein